MGDGILGLISLAGTLVFAVPVAALGLVMLGGEQSTMGLALLAVAALMVAFERYVPTPGDIPELALGKATDVVDPGEEWTEETVADDDERDEN
jgi:ABC-type Co2+ transport system permease subunit